MLFFKRCLFFMGFLFPVWASAVTDTDQFSTLFNQTNVLQRNTETMQPSYSEGTVDSSYKLGPGDFLDIMLEDKYLAVQVYPDGNITIEECGSVYVAGKTLSEAREEILKVVSKRYNPQYCFVQLAQLKRFIVSVMGAVPTVGQIHVDPQTRLSLLLRNVGNILASGNKNDVLLIRKGDTLHIDCSKIFDKGDFKNDVLLEQGDQIYVPFADMTQSVSVLLPGFRVAVPYKKDRTIQEYFKMAGGDRYPNLGYQSVSIRGKDKASRSIPISDASKETVAAGDEIEYAVKPLLVYVGGAVAGVGRVAYDPSWHALDYIAAAGVTTITGSFDQVEVVRGDRKTITVNVTGDPIYPGDYIEIPKSGYERFKDFTLFIASLLTVVSSAFIIYVNYK